MGLDAGALLGNRYRLVNPIADGALGPLWRAVDRAPDRQIAIRILKPRRTVAAAAVDAYVRELEVARGISHPAAVHVLDVGRTDEGTPWVATELLQVERLAAVLERRTLLPGTALRLIADLAGALAEAHALGLVHLGIEPARVLLHRASDGSVTAKLEGFGRARLLSSRATRGVGSAPVDVVPIPYTSPEQAAGDPKLDRASDVWGLGVLLFRCVAGREPFTATTRARHFSDVRNVARILEGAKEAIDPHVLGLVSECLRHARSQRLPAETVADRAQLLAWVTAGGWKDLEKMVRIDEAAVAPTVRGELLHVSTIPGAPKPTPSVPIALPAVTNEGPDSETTKVWTHDPEPSNAPAGAATAPSAVTGTTAPPVAQPTPLPQVAVEEIPDLRSKRPRAVAYAAIGVAALGLGALAMPRSKPARPRAAAKVTVVERGAQAEASKAPAGPEATDVPSEPEPAASQPATSLSASVKPAAPPTMVVAPPVVRAKDTPPPSATAEAAMPMPPPTAGIPLRDDPAPQPQPAKANDNPYE